MNIESDLLYRIDFSDIVYSFAARINNIFADISAGVPELDSKNVV